MPASEDFRLSPARTCGSYFEGDAVIPTGARVWIAMGHTEMRRGMQSLVAMVKQHLTKDPFGGDLWVFRGRSGSLMKIIWHGRVRQRGVISAVAVGHHQAALAVMFNG